MHSAVDLRTENPHNTNPDNQGGDNMKITYVVRAAFVAMMAVSFALTGWAESPKMKMTTPIAPGVAVPDKIETSIGTLNLSYGYPAADTVQKIYDNLDRSRALQAYLLAIPIVNQAGMRDSIRQQGPDNQTDVIWEDLVDSKTVELTANDNTIYSFIWTDTHKGPVVAEIPPKVLGIVNDFWYRWVVDVGITGPDKGAGGKYLILTSFGQARMETGWSSGVSSWMDQPNQVSSR
jgi:hypothetical protein